MRLFLSLLLTATAGGLAAGPALAQTEGTKAAVTSTPGKASVSRSHTVKATVTEIDAAKRQLTLKGPKGETLPLAVGPEVRNLDQVKVGDQLVVKYQDNLSLVLKKDGKELPGMKEGAVGARAAQGQAPAAAFVQQAEVTANVIAVDAKTQVVTLKGAQQTVELLIQDPAQFKLIKVGDQIQATYTQAVALSVEPAKK